MYMTESKTEAERQDVLESLHVQKHDLGTDETWGSGFRSLSGNL